MTLTLPEFPSATPGQFLQVLCRDREDALPTTILRRPFSIGGLRRNSQGVEIDLLGRVIGPGTRWLSSRRPGEVVDILGPLGRGFTLPDAREIAVLVAGGIGLPPIRWFAAILREKNIDCVAIVGAQSRDLLPIALREEPRVDATASPAIEEFASFGISSIVTTDDGSCGMRGRTTDALARRLEEMDANPARVYACGPESMLQAVANLCGARGARCELAMERVMGCGMGTCQSCVIPILRDGGSNSWQYALCCRDGPVFDGASVAWSV